MKFLLMFTMLVGSAFVNANASEEWRIKCFEKDHGDFDLAYIIKVDRDRHLTDDRSIELEDCTRRRGHDNVTEEECRERGDLKRFERQNESCLKLKDRDDHHEGMTNDRFTLCVQERQENKDHNRFVPVTVTDDRQEQRIWCEREILRLL